MKQLLSTLLIAITAFCFAACGGEDPIVDDDDNKGSGGNSGIEQPAGGADTLYQRIDAKVRDLALIYQGGVHRIDWTEEEFMPYISHRFLDGSEEWTFDGYLFLEFSTKPGNQGHEFTDGYGQPNARRTEWEWYLDRLFEKDKSLDALNKAIEKKKTALGDPGFKHRVALTCMVPVLGQTDWGELDGKKMVFSVDDADRTAVCRWFIDRLVSRFEAGNYRNLELYGIYMICENNYNITKLSPAVGDYVRSKGLEYLWIPYFGAGGAGDWKGLGFDIAYQQPGHFFSQKTPDSRLEEAITFARAHGMGLEFECDERALSQANPSLRSRMISYIDYFEEYGVWYDTPIAYYTGNHMLLDMVQQPSLLNSQALERLFRHIVNRRLAQK